MISRQERIVHAELEKIKKIEETNKAARLACIEEHKALIQCFKEANYSNYCGAEYEKFWKCFKEHGGVYRNKLKELFGPY